MTEMSVIRTYMLGFGNSHDVFCLVSALTIYNFRVTPYVRVPFLL